MTSAQTHRLPAYIETPEFLARLARTKAAKLVYAGDEVLRGIAAPVPQADVQTEAIQQLLATMVRTMREAPGVGLAAPQIGVNLAIAVLEDPQPAGDAAARVHDEARGRRALALAVIINPQVRRIGGSKAVSFDEGCLSVPHYAAQVRRDLAIEVTGLDGLGVPFVWRPEGWPARIVQHEVDHLRGVLYVDRMASKTFRHTS